MTHLDLLNETTIVAPASGLGGGIAIIRLSGAEALRIVSLMAHKPLSKVQQNPRKAIYSHLMGQNGKPIDDAVITYFPAPHSYTGEDVVEISCHASSYIVQTIIRESLSLGAQMAQAGEFTQRAFRNGKLDLVEAEAVADLIAAETEEQHNVAIGQLNGFLSQYLDDLSAQLLRFTSLLELELDFSEEDIEFVDRTELIKLSQEIERKLQELKNSFRSGQAIKSGIPIALIGETNVGKSSILNALLQEERAIVSNIPGTTRDTVEGILHLQGKTFRIADTAGFRNTTDSIENLGIERSKEKIDSAEILLGVIDASSPNIDKILDIIPQNSKKHIVVLLNKVDLVEHPQTLILELSQKTNYPIIPLRARYPHSGFEPLKEWLLQAAEQETGNSNRLLISSTRHLHAIEQALESLHRVIESLQSQIPSDLITPDMRLTIEHIGSITGKSITSEDTLHYIFAHFCIGK